MTMMTVQLAMFGEQIAIVLEHLQTVTMMEFVMLMIQQMEIVL